MGKETYNIKEIIERNHIEVQKELGEIKTQTQKTNGRVTKLEKWRWLLTGAVSVLVFMVLNSEAIKSFLQSFLK